MTVPMTIAKYLWVAGSLIIATLGTMHLYYTFFTNKFDTRDVSLSAAMKESFPVLTRRTTLWKAWIGFNASHSSGAMFLGLLNCYLAIHDFNYLMADSVLCWLSIANVLFFVWLGKRYWFNIPFTGSVITLLCYLLAYGIARFGQF